MQDLMTNPRHIIVFPINDTNKTFWCDECKEWHIIDISTSQYVIDYPCLQNSIYSEFSEKQMVEMYDNIDYFLKNEKRTNQPVIWNPDNINKRPLISKFKRYKCFPFYVKKQCMMVFHCPCCGKDHMISYNLCGGELQDKPCESNCWDKGVLFSVYSRDDLIMIKSLIRNSDKFKI